MNKDKIKRILEKYTDFIGNTDNPVTNLGMGKHTLVDEIATLCEEDRNKDRENTLDGLVGYAIKYDLPFGSQAFSTVKKYKEFLTKPTVASTEEGDAR